MSRTIWLFLTVKNLAQHPELSGDISTYKRELLLRNGCRPLQPDAQKIGVRTSDPDALFATDGCLEAQFHGHLDLAG
jgi:hypothetical protein